jgi:UDP-2,3-diacylglucosamine pyrophosphatase LpxH
LLSVGNVDLNKFQVKKYKVNNWGGERSGYNYQVKAELVPIHPLLSVRPAPVRNYVSKEIRPRATAMEVLFIPDIHFGYVLSGEAGVDETVLEPLHDENCVFLLLKVAAEYQPETIVLLGDGLDLPALSKFITAPRMKHLVQPAIDAFGDFLQQLRTFCPKSRIIFIKGNHEERLDNQLKMLLPEVAGICRAGETTSVLSLASLLHLEKLNIEYVAPYGKRVYVGNTMVHHGELIGKRGGDTVSKMLDAFVESSVCGHVHRLEVAYRTLWTKYGPQLLFARACGTLARIDGTLPGPLYPDWQQGFGALWFGNIPHIYPINNHSVAIDGHIISAVEEEAA